MKRSLLISSMLVLLIALASQGALGAEPDSSPILSANIPLDSFVYPYLDKLAGLGYADGLPTGTKPYTRIQAARRVAAIERNAAGDPNLPDYAKAMIERLKQEFRYELGLLDGEPRRPRLSGSWALTGAYYDGEPLNQLGTLSTYEPLWINRNGDQLAQGFNLGLALELDAELGDGFLLSAKPRVSRDGTDGWADCLESGYLKTRIGNLEIQAGRDPLWWGQGERGSLALTNNSEAKSGLKLSTIEPFHFSGLLGFLSFLGPTDAAFFYAKLAEDRSDVPSPGFTGLRMDFSPTPNFTFAGSLTSIIGGEGHEVGWGDLWDLLTGNNAVTAAGDKWDSIAGWDFRWRFPSLGGLELYGEYYGEDQACKIIPLPTKNTPVFGIFIPRLTADGRWDLTLETAQTTSVWYRHSLYTDGYTHEGQIIGDAMGRNAERAYLKLTHYLADGAILAFHGETVTMGLDAAAPQRVVSFWTTYQTRFESGWTINAELGVAKIGNKDFAAGADDTFYLVGLGVGRSF